MPIKPKIVLDKINVPIPLPSINMLRKPIINDNFNRGHPK